MTYTRLAAFAASAFVLLWALSADAQTTGRAPATQNRQTNPAFGASATRTTTGTTRQPATVGGAAGTGTGISQGMQGFAAGVPALQEAQQLRDTGLRGEFVGAEAGTMNQGAGWNQAGYGQQGAGARPNIRIQAVRQPGAQAGQAGAFGQQAGRVMQPTLSLGFAAPSPSSANLGPSIADAVVRSPSIRDGASIAVRVDAGVVTLEGTVSDSHQRALAAQLVALEPGVTKVDNRLTVVAPAVAP